MEKQCPTCNGTDIRNVDLGISTGQICNTCYMIDNNLPVTVNFLTAGHSFKLVGKRKGFTVVRIAEITPEWNGPADHVGRYCVNISTPGRSCGQLILPKDYEVKIILN